MCRHRRGFTLIELSIVLLLVGIILALTVSVGSHQQAFLVRAELAKLSAHIHITRQRALLKDARQCITLDLVGHSYNAGEHQVSLPSGIQFGFVADAKGPPAAPNQRITNASTFKHHIIECFADGTTSSGSVYLVDSRKRHMYALTVAVTDVPYVRLYRYADKWIAI